MPSVLSRRVFQLVAAGVVVLAAGCGGGKGARIEGKLTKSGQPWVPEPGQTLHLSLTGKDPKGADTVYPAAVNAGDGSFVIAGPAGAGVPPGKYKFTASLTGSGGNDPAALAKQAGLNNQVAALKGLELDVGDGSTQVISVDVGVGSITRQ